MPARPRGLLEPCAATSGTHGSEEGGAGKRRPLSDSVHWLRDTAWREDQNTGYAGNGPQVMASLRNIAVSLLHLAGITEILRTLQAICRDRTRMLAYLPL